MEHLEKYPPSVLARYAEILLRAVHQLGGRDRFVPFRELEVEVGLEPEILYVLITEHLFAELQFAVRPVADVEAALEHVNPIDAEEMRERFAEPHVRVRPGPIRRTEDELAPARRRRRLFGRWGSPERGAPRFPVAPGTIARTLR